VQRFGIVGCGDVATRAYLPGLEALGDRVSVVACFDPVHERVGSAATRFDGARAYTTYEDFLAHDGGMDLVVNLTPAPLHRQVTGEALAAGYHVLSEKPIAASLEEAQELVEVAKRQGRQLFSAPATMVTARFRWLTRLLAEGRIGKPTVALTQLANLGPAGWREYTGDPRVFYGPGVGPLIDTGVYMLHAMTGLLGPAKRVQAMGGITIPQREILIDRFAGETIEVTTNDVMLLHLDFGDNVFGHLHSSYAVPASKVPPFELHGAEGSITVSREQWFDGNGPIDLYTQDSGWQRDLPNPEPLPVAGILESGLLHVIDCLDGNEVAVMTAAHATHVLEIMLAAHESAKHGEAVELTTTF
jgi:predicted dehydrogenase